MLKEIYFKGHYLKWRIKQVNISPYNAEKAETYCTVILLIFSLIIILSRF